MQDTIGAHAHVMQWSAIDTALLPSGLLPRGEGDAFDVALRGAWRASTSAHARTLVKQGHLRQHLAAQDRRAGHCGVTRGAGNCSSGDSALLLLDPMTSGWCCPPALLVLDPMTSGCCCLSGLCPELIRSRPAPSGHTCCLVLPPTQSSSDRDPPPLATLAALCCRQPRAHQIDTSACRWRVVSPSGRAEWHGADCRLLGALCGVPPLPVHLLLHQMA